MTINTYFESIEMRDLFEHMGLSFEVDYKVGRYDLLNRLFSVRN